MRRKTWEAGGCRGKAESVGEGWRMRGILRRAVERMRGLENMSRWVWILFQKEFSSCGVDEAYYLSEVDGSMESLGSRGKWPLLA